MNGGQGRDDGRTRGGGGGFHRGNREDGTDERDGGGMVTSVGSVGVPQGLRTELGLVGGE